MGPERWRAGILATLTICLLAPAATAGVRYTHWTPDEIGSLLARQGARDGLVMVVITQPDWCPSCIELDRELLRNPDAGDIAALTKDWLVLEVFGYDADGATMLREQGLRFVGTPTTLLIRPVEGSGRLGDGKLVASIVGYPEDYAARLERASTGFDAIADAQAQARQTGSVEDFAALANAYVEHGDAAAAARVYRSLLARDDLDETTRPDLRWSLLTEVYQRVEKDHAKTLRALLAFARDYPARADEPRFSYATAWSLLELGRVADARYILKTRYLDADDADRLADYLYLVFRHPTDELLVEAEAAARAGIEKYPEQRARLTAALARILRRQGCLAEAADAFERAAELAGPEHDNYEVYLGQLEFVRSELKSGTARDCAVSQAAL